MHNSRVLLLGYGRMGSIHKKYLDELSVAFTVADPTIKVENDTFKQQINVDDFASHLLNYVSLTECVKFLDDIKGKWDSESFVEKNQDILSKYFEYNSNKYYLLSKFKNNSILKNFLIKNHFKTNFALNLVAFSLKILSVYV